MEKAREYITLNRKREWNKALLLGLQQEKEHLVLVKDEQAFIQRGVLITGAIDSTEQQYLWSYLTLDVYKTDESSLKVSTITSDHPYIVVEDEIIYVDDYLQDERITADEKIEKLLRHSKKQGMGATDLRLQAKGRYLWILIEVLVPMEQTFALYQIKLALLHEQLIAYLPVIYREGQEEDSFFRRYLSLFESSFFDLEEQIDAVAYKMDYTLATGERLRTLAKWICLEDEMEEDSLLRSQIANIQENYSRIGTKTGILDLVEREIGIRPWIVEYFEIENQVYEGEDRDTFKKLFGENPYQFFVFLDTALLHQSGKDITGLLKKIRENIPAYTDFEVISLSSDITLDRHTYLGRNSRIGEYIQLKMGTGYSFQDHIMIGGDEGDEQ